MSRRVKYSGRVKGARLVVGDRGEKRWSGSFPEDPITSDCKCQECRVEEFSDEDLLVVRGIALEKRELLLKTSPEPSADCEKCECSGLGPTPICQCQSSST